MRKLRTFKVYSLNGELIKEIQCNEVTLEINTTNLHLFSHTTTHNFGVQKDHYDLIAVVPNSLLLIEDK